MIDYKSLIAGIALFILPVLAGRVIFAFMKLNKKIILSPITYFVSGSLALFVTFVLFWHIGRIFTPDIKTVYVLNVSNILWVSLFVVSLFVKKLDFNIRKNWFIAALFLISFVLSFVTHTIWSYRSPYPLNWDVYHHQTLINNIFAGRYSVINSQITDTFIFNGYSNIFHILIAYAQNITKPEILGFWQTAQIIYSGLVVFGSSLLAYTVSKRKMLAVLTLIVNAFAFDSTISFGLHFLIPQTLMALVATFLFAQLLEAQLKEVHLPWVVVISNALILFLLHFVVGTVGVFIYIFAAVYLNKKDCIKTVIPTKLGLQIVIVLSLFFLIFAGYLPLSSINQGEAAAYNITIPEKFSIFLQTYGYIFALFIPLGIMRFIFYKNTEVENFTLFLTGCLTVFVLAQIPYAMKFFVILRPFVNLIIAYGLLFVLDIIRLKSLKWLSIFILISTFSIVYLINIFYWKTSLIYTDLYSNTSKWEIEAANYIKNKYKENPEVIVISDPATMQIFEPISGLNTPGGAYASTNTRRLVSNAYSSLSPSLFSSYIKQVKDGVTTPSLQKTVLILISNRFFKWQNAKDIEKLGVYHNIWSPSNFTFNSKKNAYLYFFNPFFEEIYSNKEIKIFRVK